jgi:apolipoprotein N-acyltransferase
MPALLPLLFSENFTENRKQWWLAALLFTVVYQAPSWWQGVDLRFGLLIFLALIFFRLVKEIFGPQRGYLALAFLWLSAEALPFYLQVFGDSSQNLAQLLREAPGMKGWISQIGFFGTSLWIWAVNLLSFWSLSAFVKHKQVKAFSGQTVLLLSLGVIAPILWAPETSQALSFPQPNPTEGGQILSAADRFIARMSFFLAAFLLLFSFVRGYLQKK